MSAQELEPEQLTIAAEPSTEPERPVSLYETADERERFALDRNMRRFVSTLLRELGKDWAYFGREDNGLDPDPDQLARLVDRESLEGDDDVHEAQLLVFPDESLMFVGRDPTATTRTIPLFGFVIERASPYPAPSTAKEALDLLRPGKVREAFDGDGENPARQGEWFLLPTDLVPVGTVFRPGVSKRPFGPSPLGSHVPREYAFTVSDDAFMERFRELAPRAPASIVEPPEAIHWLYVHRYLIDEAEGIEVIDGADGVPDWRDVQEIAGTVLVRGTFRHRENEHYVENVGEQWHEAHTHDVDVWTADAVGMERVRID